MTEAESLTPKQKTLIGVGAAIAAGCQPCTLSFAKGAREAGACERGVRFAIETGLAARSDATGAMSDFSIERLPHPEIEGAFRTERALLAALTGVAAAIAGNTAAIVQSAVDRARALGATDAQLQLVSGIARTAKRTAESETDRAFDAALGRIREPACCAQPQTPSGACGCTPAT